MIYKKKLIFIKREINLNYNNNIMLENKENNNIYICFKKL
jgi:hypothetical protein